MQALDHLPSETKNLIVPIIRMRPWLSSKSLSRSGERVQKAIGDRYFGFDLDGTKRGSGASDAHREFLSLFDPANGWENYYSHISQFPGSIPVLRSTKSAEVAAELNRVREMERGLFVRIDVASPIGATEIAHSVIEAAIENVVFVLDCGWRSALLPYQAQCIGLLRNLTSRAPNAEFVVAGGDFPMDGFDKSGTHFQIPGEERSLVEGARREINEAEIVFGDWASARPPRVDSEIRRNRPRIDMPTRNGWECWRKSTPGKSYAEIARSAALARGLGESSDLWGHQMIIATGNEEGVTQIRAPSTAAAVRINLHMIMQAHFHAGGGATLGDELVETEL